MFGTYRTALAILVVAGHLGPVRNVGAYAVFAFYVLSGYLMTAILHKDYGYSLGGVGRYALNRVLRIFPMYWLALLLSLGLIALLGESAARAYHAEMGLVLSNTDIARNLLLVLSSSTPTRWVPPAWALTVELFFYALIGLGLSRWAWLTLAWLACSLIYTAYLVVGSASFSYRYFPLAAASLPFATGAAVYHLRAMCNKHQAWRPPARLMWWLLTLFAANITLAAAGSPLALGAQFYCNIVLAAGMTWSLADWRADPFRSVDTMLGNLSYPTYLLHYQAGMCVLLLGFSGARGDWAFLAPSLVLTLCLAWLMSMAIDPLFQTSRARIRSGALLSQPQAGQG